VGLAISRRLYHLMGGDIHLMGGDIEVVGALGRGTTVTVRPPAEGAETDAQDPLRRGQ
jgi:signal transduction histidine kinase